MVILRSKERLVATIILMWLCLWIIFVIQCVWKNYQWPYTVLIMIMLIIWFRILGIGLVYIIKRK